MTTLLPPNVKVHLALGFIDVRKGIDGLAMLVQGVLQQDPTAAPSAGQRSARSSPPPSSTMSSPLPISRTCSNVCPMDIPPIASTILLPWNWRPATTLN
jgi:hypothetical protein